MKTIPIYSGRYALVLFILLVVGFLLFAFIPRMDADAARIALTDGGYTRIIITGPHPDSRMCSKDDWYRTGFTALNPDGQPVTGYVCSGRYKAQIFIE